MPNGSASMRVTTPAVGRRDGVRLARRGERRHPDRRPARGSSRATRPSPGRRRAPPRRRRRAARRASSISRARATVSSTTSAGPPPASTSTDSRTSLALPIARPSGVFMSVSSAVVATPGVGAERDHRAGELARAVDVAHERARAELHVEHERVGALGDLLRHDARGDERDRLDRAGDVAQRVELLVGRGEARAGGADHRADVAQLREQLVVRSAPRASRGSTRACRACRRCDRGRGRRAAARRRRTRRPAARAAA